MYDKMDLNKLSKNVSVSGGQHYDKTQVILKTLDPSKPQQKWDVEVI